MSEIITVVGARPQFIKAAAVSRQFQEKGINEAIIHTGQHFDENMAEIFFREMQIPLPKYNLDIHSLPHGAMTGRMLEEIEKVLVLEKPKAVVVFGDTNSTLAGSLAASKLHVPVAHIEAGLRSFNMKMPEEINRILTDRISDTLFCPNEIAVQNLLNEGFGKFHAEICNCGDVMYDAALFYSEISESTSAILNILKLRNKPYILVTLHRQENTDDLTILGKLVETLNILSEEYRIVLPMHPRTRKIIENESIPLAFAPIEPVGYFDMIELIKNCSFVITDSGGLQKESYFFGKHCIVIRNETEWTELVDLGYNFLAGTEQNNILNAVNILKNLHIPFHKKPFGNGDAAKKIAARIKEKYL